MSAHSRDPLDRNDGLKTPRVLAFENSIGTLHSKCNFHPCTTDLAIMQWMPLEPFTVCVTRRSAARLQSV